MGMGPRDGEVSTFPGSSFLLLSWGAGEPPAPLKRNFSAHLLPAPSASHQAHLHKKCTKMIKAKSHVSYIALYKWMMFPSGNEISIYACCQVFLMIS